MSETDLTGLDAAELATRIHAREISATEVTEAHLARIAENDARVNAFLHLDAEGARATARQVDAGLAAGGAPPSPLAGVPVALQDAFTTEGLPTTCGSRTLRDWVPPYDATVTRKLRDGGAPVLGKTNMDEFGMGSSTEHSAFGPTRNPWDAERVPGGSGGGSVASAAAFETPLSVGVDGGGSIRQPGALTGLVTAKPTYGGVSRYGQVVAASSLDQAGPCARTVTDAALLHELIGGYDPLDSTSRNTPVPPVLAAAREGALGDLTGTRVGVISEFAADAQVQEGVSRSFQAAVAQLRALGAEVVEVSCPQVCYALSAHYLIAASEASSNLARFDAMRYGLRAGDDGTHGADRVTALSRADGFGAEVKRRLVLGTYALSEAHYEDCFGAAQRARTLVCRDVDSAFSRVDVLVSPTSPTTAAPVGAHRNDPMGMYRSDRFTVTANLAGTPAMNVPSGLADDDDMPVGLQIMAPAMADERMYRVAAAYERARDEATGRSFAARVPELKGGAVR